MNRLSAIDGTVELAQLVPPDDLADVARGVAELHGVRVVVLDGAGAELVAVGAGAAPAAARRELVCNGEIVGEVAVAPGRGDEALAPARAVELADHLALVLGALIRAGFARHLTEQVHTAAMEEAFSELSARNKRLAAAMERLEEVDQLKAQFLATISHELRTPLTSVIGYAEMLLEGLAGGLAPEQHEFVETILGKADHLLQLITGILDVSLMEAKALELAKKPVSLLELVEAVVTNLSSEAERRRIVIARPEEAGPRAHGDPRKLRQVVLHLIANAIKFTPDGGGVRVELGVGPLSPEDRSTIGSPFWLDRLSERFGVRLSVSDTGIGIPIEVHQSIFEPFFQVDQSSTRAYGGTGLGLSLAKSYVEAHGGFIWVESRPGGGSTFTVSLPAVGDDLEAYVSQQAPRSGG